MHTDADKVECAVCGRHYWEPLTAIQRQQLELLEETSRGEADGGRG